MYQGPINCQGKITLGIRAIYDWVLKGNATILGVHRGYDVVYIDIGSRVYPLISEGKHIMHQVVLFPNGAYWKDLPDSCYEWTKNKW